jgi:hypothetical protein
MPWNSKDQAQEVKLKMLQKTAVSQRIWKKTPLRPVKYRTLAPFGP